MVGQFVTIAVGQIATIAVVVATVVILCDNCGGVATVMINCDNCEKVACMLVIVL